LEKPSASGQASPADERLDSWKEIASYLKRSVRGVQRWEAEEGMPVHRHRHDKRGTIFAFKPELDAWWRERGALLADENGTEEAARLSADRAPALELETPAFLPSVETTETSKEVFAPVPREPIRAALIGAGVALAVLSVVLVAWLSRNVATSTRSLPPLPFTARDWVLLTSFENRTGEPIFDGTLENALTRELGNSRHVNVVSPERVGDALRLMRRPLDTRVDAALGREICLRDGEIRALLTGRIEKLGSKYLFSVEMVEPKQGMTVVGFVEETTGKDGTFSALRRISDRVRESLGEAQSAEDRRKSALAKVTTSSLKALQLYSQADLLMRRDNQAAAEELLKQAVAEDPGFASAHIHLAWAMRNQERPVAEWRSHADTALRLSENTTERERYFIRGSYYDLLGQKPEATAAYEALLSLHPDHLWAARDLWSLYGFPNGLEKIVGVRQRLADLRPNDLDANVAAAWHLTVWKRDPVRARPYLLRARALLIDPGYTEESNSDAVWIELLPVAEKWLAGRVPDALKELNRVSAKIDAIEIPEAREAILYFVGHWYATLGLLDAAERVHERIPDPDARNDLLAQMSLLRGHTVGLRDRLESRQLKEITFYPTFGATVVLAARSGVRGPLLRRWLAFAERLATEELLDVHRGELALAGGKPERGIALLQRGTANLVYFGGSQTIQLGLESLAAALEQRGETQRAVQVLEQASQTRYLAAMAPSAAYWMRNQNRLARLYRKIGRETEARAIDAELRNLLAFADADHPILAALNARAAY
jgi:tetratricopeptide (TPR) repeat protein